VMKKKAAKKTAPKEKHIPITLAEAVMLHADAVEKLAASVEDVAVEIAAACEKLLTPLLVVSNHQPTWPPAAPSPAEEPATSEAGEA
jgi:hypothetical protein